VVKDNDGRPARGPDGDYFCTYRDDADRRQKIGVELWCYLGVTTGTLCKNADILAH